MLDKVDDNNVSMARLCKRARPDNCGLGEEPPSVDDIEERDLLGVLGISASCEVDLNRDIMLARFLCVEKGSNQVFGFAESKQARNMDLKANSANFLWHVFEQAQRMLFLILVWRGTCFLDRAFERLGEFPAGKM